MRRKERFDGVIRYFTEHQPTASTELHYVDPYELMVAVVLSAQCTDKRVNLITPGFFRRFPTIESLADASFDDVIALINSCSYPNNKARHLIAMARKLRDDYDGIVPSDRDELQKLPGIGRKSANVIASVAFHQPFIAVDTHVFRVAARIGLTHRAKNPLQAEEQLVRYIPEKLIPVAHHWLILHGRYICQARKPRCGECPLTSWCAFFFKIKEQG
ncbi:MAG: endonuclease III [Bacteroidales bacterium]|nr:endonuclease III [Lentimicrobiaceae bacterium]MDD5694692.1 endonuclease III [Bacteroidales bacterium]